MREIKFRVWDKDKKVMHYDFQFIKNGDWTFYFSDKDVENILNSYFVNRFEIMQYTELKDKNDKEIYEGDIVNKNMPTEVIYQKGSYCIWYQGYLFALNERLSVSEIEVIGNKYENPELMEKQNER